MKKYCTVLWFCDTICKRYQQTKNASLSRLESGFTFATSYEYDHQTLHIKAQRAYELGI